MDIPKNWKVLLGRVRQSRVGEPREISSIPVIESPFFRAPARYRRLVLSNLNPVRVSVPGTVYKKTKLSGLAGELSELNSYVLSRVQRKYLDVPRMLKRRISTKVTSIAMEEHKEWDAVNTLEDWKRFRDKKFEFFKDSFGEFPKTKPPLLFNISGTYKGDGYQVKNIVYQSRPGFFVAANLYLPENPTSKMPGIVIIPAHHYPKTRGVYKDLGIIWARTGCAVLVPETLGHGERIETVPWDHQAYYSEYLIEMQLSLVGQSRYGWIVWDIMRAVDLFYEMDNIDREKIILVSGSTWGSGPPAAVAGVFEKRFNATIITNFGRVYWYTGGGWRLRNCTSNKISDWFVCASMAPRKFIYSHEFWWEGAEGPVYPSVWVPAWPRYKKLYKLYGAEENLEKAQNFGLLNLDIGHCYLTPKEIYPVLKKWFDIPMPSKEDLSIVMDSDYAVDRPDFPVIKLKESKRRMPDTALLSITPKVSAKLNRKPMHQIALEMGEDLLESARSKRTMLDDFSRRQGLMKKLSNLLGDIEPNQHPQIENQWSKKLSGGIVEALILHSEQGIIVPVFILKPIVHDDKRVPVVIALSEGGKDRFLKNRSREIEKLIQSGIAVCLPDVRGTGETVPDQYNRSDRELYEEIPLGNTLLGLRLKDVRTILAYIKTRSDFNSKQIALWGDSFAPVNIDAIWVDELQQQPSSPQIQHYASPLGAHLALLTAFYHNEINAVAVRGGLIGYLSLLKDNFTYVPPNIAVPEILKVGDINDICASLVPMPLLIEKFVDGRNFIAKDNELQKEMDMVRKAYQKSMSLSNLIIRKDDNRPDMISWIIKQLKK